MQVAAAAAAAEPGDADVQRRLKVDRLTAVEALDNAGMKRLIDGRSFPIRFRPLVPGSVTIRVTARRLLLASARRTFRKPGSYRVKLRATEAGRRHLRANPTTRWKVQLQFRPAGSPMG